MAYAVCVFGVPYTYMDMDMRARKNKIQIIEIFVLHDARIKVRVRESSC